MPSAAEVVEQLALPAELWALEKADDVARPAVGPDGQEAELLDSVVVARRR